MFKLPIIRYTFFCSVLLVLLFSNLFTVGTFFLVGGSFAIIEKFLDYKKYDKKTGKIIIDYGWILIFILTLLIIYFNKSYIIF